MLDFDGIINTISRVTCTFVDTKGNVKSASGTGFWISDDDLRPIFITNRHMIDAEYFNIKYKDYALKEMSFYLRLEAPHNQTNSTVAVPLQMEGVKITKHMGADLAILSGCNFDYDKAEIISIRGLHIGSLANSNYFKDRLNLLDACAFIGFPGDPINGCWWDEELGLPIARGANIASYPPKDYVNKTIKSTAARLVTGLSFNGSSGSPIFCNGTKVMQHGNIKISGFIDYKCIGIMAGHLPIFDKNDFTPPMLRHSGLSYFVTSAAILELLSS